jgi:hypothetical protein
LGLLLGYVAYVPALGIILFLTYGRVDRDLFFYGLLLPIQLPLLLLEDFRGSLQGEELLLLVFGVSLQVLGVVIAIKLRRKVSKRMRIEDV